MDVTSKAYRKLLSQAFSSGALDAADSKANYLQNLCDQLHFDPEKASEIHEGTAPSYFLIVYGQELLT